MINTIKETIKVILGIEKKIDEEDLECAIDEDVVDCKEMEEEPYVGVPAPVVLTEDSWFGPAVVSDANKDYMELEYEAFKQDALNYYPDSKEPENIHQVMYEMATKSGATTIQLDPIGGSENFQGGSENVHR